MRRLVPRIHVLLPVASWPPQARRVFGSGVPKQRRIVVLRGAGGDARKRIPVINKIHAFTSVAGV